MGGGERVIGDRDVLGAEEQPVWSTRSSGGGGVGVGRALGTSPGSRREGEEQGRRGLAEGGPWRMHKLLSGWCCFPQGFPGPTRTRLPGEPRTSGRLLRAELRAAGTTSRLRLLGHARPGTALHPPELARRRGVREGHTCHVELWRRTRGSRGPPASLHVLPSPAHAGSTRPTAAQGNPQRPASRASRRGVGAGPRPRTVDASPKVLPSLPLTPRSLTGHFRMVLKKYKHLEKIFCNKKR